ncbi:MAG: Mov34/MPN/PAD-1 family protein [Rhodanobacter sp.]
MTSKTRQGWQWTWAELEVELLVSNHVATVLRRQRQPPGGIERGGLLFVDPNDPSGLVLVRATPPHPADRAGEHSIIMDEMRCAQEIDKANSDGLRLIGFWHSHPENFPDLSPVDIKNFRSLGQRSHLDLPWPVAIIVGRDRSEEGIRAWSVRPERIYRAKQASRSEASG